MEDKKLAGFSRKAKTPKRRNKMYKTKNRALQTLNHHRDEKKTKTKKKTYVSSIS